MTQKLITASQIDVGSNTGQVAVHNGALDADTLNGLAASAFYLATNPSGYLSTAVTSLTGGAGITTSASTGAVTLSISNGAITNAMLANSSVPVDLDGVGTTTLTLGSIFNFFGTANQITTTASSGTVTFALANINSNVGTYTNANITVDATGRITAVSNGTNGTVTSITVTGSSGIGVSGSPVTSSGTVSLSLGDITPTSVAATGPISTNVLATDTTTTGPTSLSSGVQTTVDTFDITVYRSVKYQIQVTSGSSYHCTEILVVQDGTTVYTTEYAQLFTSSSLGTFSASISGSNVILQFQPVNTATFTIKVAKFLITV